ncbi:MAG: hypothetical protein EXR72_25785 [Myxococcales bacterium]|nr:hypothetical protein [Myxococcales bacterium]
MPRPTFTRRRFVSYALLVGLLGQAPGALLLAIALAPAVGGAARPIALGLCALLTLPLAVRMGIGVSDHSESGLLGGSLIALFAWWGTSMVAGCAAPVTMLLAAAVGAPRWTGAVTALALGALAGVGGVTVRRTRARLRRIEVALPDLPAALDGYRIAHLSDLHMSGYTPPSRVRSWVDRINALDPDLVAVTGDLITSGDRYLDDLARELGRLRGRDGVALCMGDRSSRRATRS